MEDIKSVFGLEQEHMQGGHVRVPAFGCRQCIAIRDGRMQPSKALEEPINEIYSLSMRLQHLAISLGSVDPYALPPEGANESADWAMDALGEETTELENTVQALEDYANNLFDALRDKGEDV